MPIASSLLSSSQTKLFGLTCSIEYQGKAPSQFGASGHRSLLGACRELCGDMGLSLGTVISQQSKK